MKWRYEKSTKTIRRVPENHWIASMDSWDGAEDHEANAEFIVQACNSHADLLEACRGLIDMITDNRLHGPEVFFAADAIAAAEGGK